MLPYVEDKNLQDLINFKVAYNDPLNNIPRNTRVPMFLCPSDTDINLNATVGAATSYHANQGTGILWSNLSTPDERRKLRPATAAKWRDDSQY